MVRRWIGIDKAKIEVVHEKWQDRDHRDWGDNDAADPEQNWDLDNFKEEDNV